MDSRPLAIVALAGLALAGCGTDFAPESYLNDLRVLAVIASPAELGPGESVALTPVVFARADDPVVATRWSFCPLTLGSSAGYACALSACETPLTPGQDGAVVEDPSGLALDCLNRLGSAPPPGFEVGQVPEVIDAVFRLHVESASGKARDAVKRVPLHFKGAPAPRNLPPVIAAVELDGVAVSPGAVGATIPGGGKVPVTVRIEPSSIETYVDGNGRTVQETVVVSFFATAGRLDDLRGNAPVAETNLVAKDLEAGQAEALAYAVARDLRGGEAVAGPFRVAIGR